MSPSRSEALAWEERWSLRAGLAALAAVAFIVVGIVVASRTFGGGEGEAEFLRNIDQHRDAQLLSSILQGIGLVLVAGPLYFLFRAARARSETMRGQLVGIVVVAPLFMALAAVLTGVSNLDAATDFLAKHVAGNSQHADDIASNALSDASLRSLGVGLGFAGAIGFSVAMLYACLHAMRVGLLPRFWGSLGMALGAVTIFFFPYNLLWFVYLGLVLLGRLPNGRPPAWETGEAIPWPSPGEKAAAELAPPEDSPPSKETPQAEDPPASPAEDPEKPIEKGQSQ
jgi:hypothetical protein